MARLMDERERLAYVPYQIPFRRTEEKIVLLKRIRLRDIRATAVPIILAAQIYFGCIAHSTAAAARKREIFGLYRRGRRRRVLEMAHLVKAKRGSQRLKFAPLFC